MSEENVVTDTDPCDLRLSSEEADRLEASDVDPDAVRDRSVSFRQLLEADVEESFAAELRKRFSLPWSFRNDGDLDRRSAAVRGLGEAEREWVAASADEAWQAFEAVLTRAAEREEREPIERPVPRSTPIQLVTAVGPDDATALAEAGINSADRLATVDAAAVAKALDLEVIQVRVWKQNAREAIEARRTKREASPDTTADRDDRDGRDDREDTEDADTGDADTGDTDDADTGDTDDGGSAPAGARSDMDDGHRGETATDPSGSVHAADEEFGTLVGTVDAVIRDGSNGPEPVESGADPTERDEE